MRSAEIGDDLPKPLADAVRIVDFDPTPPGRLGETGDTGAVRGLQAERERVDLDAWMRLGEGVREGAEITVAIVVAIVNQQELCARLRCNEVACRFKAKDDRPPALGIEPGEHVGDGAEAAGARLDRDVDRTARAARSRAESDEADRAIAVPALDGFRQSFPGKGEFGFAQIPDRAPHRA